MTLTSELGHGAFGKVWQGEIEPGLIQELKTRVTTEEKSVEKVETTGELSVETVTVAVKVLHGKNAVQCFSCHHALPGIKSRKIFFSLDNPNIDDRKEFLREIELMKTVGFHRNIVCMVACGTKEEQVFLVVEYAMHGDLLKHLRKQRVEVKPMIHCNILFISNCF